MKPREIKKLQARSKGLRARLIAPNTVVVSSRSNPYAQHIVTLESRPGGAIKARCTCPWSQHGGHGCSHVMAALNYLAARRRRAISYWPTLSEAKRQKHRILRLEGISGSGDDIFITSRPA